MMFVSAFFDGCCDYGRKAVYNGRPPIGSDCEINGDNVSTSDKQKQSTNKVSINANPYNRAVFAALVALLGCGAISYSRIRQLRFSQSTNRAPSSKHPMSLTHSNLMRLTTYSNQVNPTPRRRVGQVSRLTKDMTEYDLGFYSYSYLYNKIESNLGAMTVNSLSSEVISDISYASNASNLSSLILKNETTFTTNYHSTSSLPQQPSTSTKTDSTPSPSISPSPSKTDFEEKSNTVSEATTGSPLISSPTYQVTNNMPAGYVPPSPGKKTSVDNSSVASASPSQPKEYDIISNTVSNVPNIDVGTSSNSTVQTIVSVPVNAVQSGGAQSSKSSLYIGYGAGILFAAGLISFSLYYFIRKSSAEEDI